MTWLGAWTLYNSKKIGLPDVCYSHVFTDTNTMRSFFAQLDHMQAFKLMSSTFDLCLLLHVIRQSIVISLSLSLSHELP